MTKIGTSQKQIIFDYSMGIASGSESAIAQELVFSNAEAALLYGKIKRSLSVLDDDQTDDCPQELVNATVAKLIDASRSSHMQLKKLINDEQAKADRQKSFFIRHFDKILGYAAAFLLISGILLTSFTNIRQNYSNRFYGQEEMSADLSALFNAQKGDSSSSYKTYLSPNSSLLDQINSHQVYIIIISDSNSDKIRK